MSSPPLDLNGEYFESKYFGVSQTMKAVLLYLDPPEVYKFASLSDYISNSNGLKTLYLLLFIFLGVVYIIYSFLFSFSISLNISVNQGRISLLKLDNDLLNYILGDHLVSISSPLMIAKKSNIYIQHVQHTSLRIYLAHQKQ